MVRPKFANSKFGSLQHVVSSESGVKVSTSNNNVYSLNEDQGNKTWNKQDFFTMVELRKEQFDKQNALKHTSGAVINKHALSWPRLTIELNKQ